MIPSSIGVSRRSGEEELMTVNSDGSAPRVSLSTPLQRFIVDAARDFHQFDRIEIALAPEAVSVDRFVRQRQHIEDRVEMAHGCMNSDRLDGIAAPQMDLFEALAELDEILDIAVIAGSAAPLAIEGIRRAGDGAE